MDTLKKLSDIINSLDTAIVDSNWESVTETINDLNFLYEELQSDYPFEDVENED